MKIVILTIAIAFIIYILIKGKLKKKHNNGKMPNIVYKLTKSIYPASSRRAMILKAHNIERDDFSLPLLYSIAQFDFLARGRCDYINYTNKVTHEGVQDTFLKMQEMGSDNQGENIAYGYRDPMSGWMKSKNHRNNLLNKKWDAVGIHCLKDEHNKWIDVVLFHEEK